MFIDQPVASYQHSHFPFSGYTYRHRLFDRNRSKINFFLFLIFQKSIFFNNSKINFFPDTCSFFYPYFELIQHKLSLHFQNNFLHNIKLYYIQWYRSTNDLIQQSNLITKTQEVIVHSVISNPICHIRTKTFN